MGPVDGVGAAPLRSGPANQFGKVRLGRCSVLILAILILKFPHVLSVSHSNVTRIPTLKLWKNQLENHCMESVAGHG